MSATIIMIMIIIKENALVLFQTHQELLCQPRVFHHSSPILPCLLSPMDPPHAASISMVTESISSALLPTQLQTTEAQGSRGGCSGCCFAPRIRHLGFPALALHAKLDLNQCLRGSFQGIFPTLKSVIGVNTPKFASLPRRAAQGTPLSQLQPWGTVLPLWLPAFLPQIDSWAQILPAVWN